MHNTNNPFEFFQHLWNQTPGGNNPFTSFPTLEDIEQRMAELTAVEQWLKIQLTMVEAGLKTLEMQKAGLASFTPSSKEPRTET